MPVQSKRKREIAWSEARRTKQEHNLMRQAAVRVARTAKAAERAALEAEKATKLRLYEELITSLKLRVVPRATGGDAYRDWVRECIELRRSKQIKNKDGALLTGMKEQRFGQLANQPKGNLYQGVEATGRQTFKRADVARGVCKKILKSKVLRNGQSNEQIKAFTSAAITTACKKNGTTPPKGGAVSKTFMKSFSDEFGFKTTSRAGKDNQARVRAVSAPRNIISNFSGLRSITHQDYTFDKKPMHSKLMNNIDAFTVWTKEEEGEMVTVTSNSSLLDDDDELAALYAAGKNQSSTVQADGSLNQAMKFTVTTKQDGSLGPIMGVIADKNLDDDYFEYEEVPDMHPTGGKFLLAVVKSRAGTTGMWQVYLDAVLDDIEADRKTLDTMGAFSEYSRQAVVTMDGENMQINTVLEPEFIEKAQKQHTVIYKYPSGCSGVLQPNDLMKMHTVFHKNVPKLKMHGNASANGVKQYLRGQLAHRLWPPDHQPSAKKIELFGSLLGGFKLAAPKATAPLLIQSGWRKSGVQDDGTLSFELMAQGFTCYKQIGNPTCMGAWKVMSTELTKSIFLQGQLLELQMDAMEPTNPEFATQSVYEQKMRDSQPDRDLRTLTHRRAVILSTKASVATRKENQRLLDLHAQQLVRDRDDKARKAHEQRCRKIAAVAKRTTKRLELKMKQKKDAIFSAELHKASLLSIQYDHDKNACDHECDGDCTDGCSHECSNDWVCSNCGLTFFCAQHHITSAPDKWFSTGWKACAKSTQRNQCSEV